MDISIEEYKDLTRIIYADEGIIDLNKTFNCGQSFRWEQVANNVYSGVIYGKLLMLKQMQFDDGKIGIATTLNIEETKHMLVKYLGLDRDYSKELNINDLDVFAKTTLEFGAGIRILKQEPWEALVSFIIYQRNSIPKIKSTIKRLCKELSNEVKLQIGKNEYIDYSFPTIEKVLEVGLDGLQGLGLGYRDVYILSAAQAVKNGVINLEALDSSNITGDEVVEELLKLYGVGNKVANCVALFGFGKLDMFPIDVWIQRVIDQYYNGEIDIDKYGSLAGLVQQYMFYYIKNN